MAVNYYHTPWPVSNNTRHVHKMEIDCANFGENSYEASDRASGRRDSEIPVQPNSRTLVVCKHTSSVMHFTAYSVGPLVTCRSPRGRGVPSLSLVARVGPSSTALENLHINVLLIHLFQNELVDGGRWVSRE